ncbi:MAG: trehalase family glycosidase [Candidatus Cloacimonadales bacterium]|nr:trehalase family glycosidase [Candidatus Cloacimonadales bacterium]
MNILELLERDDKWYLGGGDSLIFTPLFPQWLHIPGLCDEAHFYNIPIKPLYTISFLSKDGKELKPKLFDTKWNPSKLIRRFTLANDLTLIEIDVMLPNDTLSTTLNFKGKNQEIDVILWTAQANNQNEKTLSFSKENNGILFNREVKLRKKYPFNFSLFLGMEHSSYSINLSDYTSNQPKFEYTPFYEKFAGKLPDEIHNKGINPDGLLYIGLHQHLKVTENTEAKIFLSVAKTSDQVKKKFNEAVNIKNPIKESEKKWQEFFNSVPHFECSDKFIEKYYWYRWFGLRLFMMKNSYSYPCVCEGPAYFRMPISYSAQCHMLETRWMDNSKIAEGSFLNFMENQEENGSYPGNLYPLDIDIKSFYHADFGTAIMEIYKVHPDINFLQKAYPSLVKYAEFFDKERDPEHSYLYDVIDQMETGQEFMTRYTSVDKKADLQMESGGIKLKGVDATCYQYGIRKALSFIAEKLEKESESKKWIEEAAKIKEAVLKYMWDENEEMFFDVNPENWKRSNIKAAVCFYPYMSDIADESHLDGMKKHLFNKDEFWTSYPVPSTALNEPLSSSFGEWKEKRMNCPWNGRTWPMTNSHIAEALVNVASKYNENLKEKAGWFIKRTIEMMFLNGDLKYPNTYEHYNPHSGKPCLYRGVNDYQHSWIVDLIIKYICGIQPQLDGSLIIDPLLLGLKYLKIDNVSIKGHIFKVEIENDKIQVYVDGVLENKSRIGESIKL